MTNLTCPKCRLGITDDALDVGQCPACGFPLDGPVVITPPGARTGSTRLVIAAGIVAALAGSSAAGYFFLGESDVEQRQPEQAFVELPTPDPVARVTHIAPYPREKRVSVTPTPVDPKAVDEKGQPVVVEVPKREGPRPVPVVMKVDPKVAAVRHFDHPDDIAAIPDLNTTDKVVLTGRVRALRIGSVHGKGNLDASKLIAEEVIITGDLNSEAVVVVNAPNGKVTVGGFVFGSAKLTITAPGGEVLFAESSRASGGTVITITAKRLDVKAMASGAAKFHVTFTAGGSLKFTLMTESAIIMYTRAARRDPKPTVEKGDLRGGARIFEVDGQP